MMDNGHWLLVTMLVVIGILNSIYVCADDDVYVDR